uniref:DNA-directed RNA polymerase subunit beta n=1 Tax=Panagrolaimus sp. PS1159 TaxID=55785 RepID=A0AC35G0Z6_9BILA
MECEIASYHVESYNYLADTGVKLAALDVPAVKFRTITGENTEIKFIDAQLGKPSIGASKSSVAIDRIPIFPAECRQRGLTYRAPLSVRLGVFMNGVKAYDLNFEAGEVPVMLKSNRCHLYGMEEKELIAHNEEPLEKGGYFICKGSEKIIRLLVCNRSNYPYAIIRNSYKGKGKFFTEYGIMMRSVREMHSAAISVLHYLDTSTFVMSIQYRREIFYVPFMYLLRALTDLNDYQIFEHITRGRPEDGFFASCVKNMIRNARGEKVDTRKAALNALGSSFRVVLNDRLAPWETDEDAANFILKYCLCIHLQNDEDKFFCLIYQAQKLMALVQGQILGETPDSPQFQEASVSGHILLAFIRERLENQLVLLKRKLNFMEKKKGDKFQFSEKAIQLSWGGSTAAEITNGLEYFLATGNLLSKTGIGLMQTTGFAVIAERINQLRFVSHFRAVHRGSFFMEMRTTDARKLRPEAWGFICPVHTPDGAPCGLLNHVTASCRIVNSYDARPAKLLRTVTELGVIPHSLTELAAIKNMYHVYIDGKFVGYIERARAPAVVQHLRKIKITSSDTRLPSTAEITLIRHSTDPQNVLTQYPGLYIFTNPGRFIRPVKNLLFDTIEMIGTFEQVYLSIVIDPTEAEPGVTMHQELHPSALFSFAGNLIPFPDHNQSPRNVYQCQMGKQTMGIPVHAWHARCDNKMYRLQFPQKPLLKPEAYDIYKMDDYPLGTNACVAVISYTGYDMEDAMTINKSSYERGFGHGTVIKVEVVDLMEGIRFATKENRKTFARDNNDITIREFIGEDGLPYQGKLYKKDDPIYSYREEENKEYKIKKFKYVESAICGYIRIVESGADLGKTKALIQWRYPRNPIIGDKFASRHGQKGINSFLWPQESLPFSESGMVPDIIFNPHGYPSRMTIGMMIESMAGKAAATHGEYYDASPFVFNEKNTAINHFGELLQKAGYNYYGEEVLYSGITGEEMKVQIFFGIVYYQRLRHMIADKFQVRGTGPVDPATLQPVKGRKKGGGIRFGEMERDSLIAHGVAFCLQDRLLISSDLDSCKVCGNCGSILTVTRNFQSEDSFHTFRETCKSCPKKDQKIYHMQVPRVFCYLAAELAAMNIRVITEVKPPI